LVPTRACSRSENHHWHQLQAACIRLENPLCSGWYQVRACSRLENLWYQLQPASAWIMFLRLVPSKSLLQLLGEPLVSTTASLYLLGKTLLFWLVSRESLEPLREPLVPTTGACIRLENHLCSGLVPSKKMQLLGEPLVPTTACIRSAVGTSEMADWQFWGVVNHRWGSDARLQFEPCQPFG
jgi:hypothetical protein